MVGKRKTPFHDSVPVAASEKLGYGDTEGLTGDIPEGNVEAAGPLGSGTTLEVRRRAKFLEDGLHFEGGTTEDKFGMAPEFVVRASVAPAGQARVGDDFDESVISLRGPVERPAEGFRERGGEFVEANFGDAEAGGIGEGGGGGGLGSHGWRPLPMITPPGAHFDFA